MEDASAVDLDWFLERWFYTTDYSDIGVKEVKSYRLTNKPTQKMLDLAKKYNVDMANVPPLVYLSMNQLQKVSQNLYQKLKN